jgi:hypothetical protein
MTKMGPLSPHGTLFDGQGLSHFKILGLNAAATTELTAALRVSRTSAQQARCS